MKNTIKLLAIALTTMFVGCQNDNYETPPAFTDAGWYTSLLQNPVFNAGIDKYVSFADLSVGAIEHKWTIDEGNFFLKGPIDARDSVFDPFIINPGDTESEDATIHVLFKKSQMQKVHLRNTFPDSVAFRAGTFTNFDTGEEYDSIVPAVKEGDVWVLEQTFEVDVYDTIVPAIQIEQDGVVKNHLVATDTIEVEAGGTLKMISTSTIGRPNTWAWQIGSASASGETADILLKKLGSYSGSLLISRARLGAVPIPGDFEFYEIPVGFKVIPSSQPFVQTGDVIEMEDETIQIPFNGEFAPFASQLDYFTVNVNGSPFEIESIETNSQDATILEIKLKEPIYRPDVITVSYDGNGTLESTDTRKPAAFTDLAVNMHNVNLLDEEISGFENNGAGWNPAWDHDASTSSIEFITGDQVYEGTYSLKITRNGAGKSGITWTDYFTFEPGVDYKLSYRVYAEGGSAGSITMWNNEPWTQKWQSLGDGAADWQCPGGCFDTWGLIDNKILSLGTEDVDIGFYLNGDGTYYIDDIHMVVNEVRP